MRLDTEEFTETAGAKTEWQSIEAYWLQSIQAYWPCVVQEMDNKKRGELEGLVQKWQGTAKKARRHADACYAEAQAKAGEAEEATAQVHAQPCHMTQLYSYTEPDQTSSRVFLYTRIPSQG